MDNLVTSQAHIFLIFVINGILIAFIFDIFRITRKSFKTPDWVTYVEDILFWLITCIILAYSIYKYNNGEIRLFMFIATLIGSIIYILTISKYIIKMSVRIINILKKIFNTFVYYISFPVKILYKTIKKILFKPICFIFINFRKRINKILQKNINKSINTQK